MNAAEINILEEIELDNPIFIEALPGLGHVGKLAADHMIDELNATKFAEIYSPSFPPQVLIKEDGIIDNMLNELYYLKDVGEDNLDLICPNCHSLTATYKGANKGNGRKDREKYSLYGNPELED